MDSSRYDAENAFFCFSPDIKSASSSLAPYELALWVDHFRPSKKGLVAEGNGKSLI